MMAINLEFIAINGLGMWHWNLLTQETILGTSIFTFDQMRNENFSQAAITWEKNLHPDDCQRVDCDIQALIHDGKELEIDYRVHQENGQFFYIKSIVKVYCDDAGKLIKIDGVNIDITELKLSEEKLKLTSSVFTHGQEGISIIDLAGNII